MSPFKGQGANQALQDGPLVADYLQRSRPDAAVRGIWREAVQRTAKVVEASRQAAGFWHSPDCLVETDTAKSDQLCHFAGVRDDSCALLLKILCQRNITADLAGNLDLSVREVIEELQIRDPAPIEDEQVCRQFYPQILDSATRGETEKLRQLSLVHAPAIRLARNENHQSALHLASLHGHYQTCRWLVTEVFMEPDSDADSTGNVPMDYASDPSVLSLLQNIIRCRKSQ
jgi:hypothetical protein